MGEVEEKSTKVGPAGLRNDGHHWLIVRGRDVCIASKGSCGSGTIEDMCEFKEKTDE